MYIQTVVKLGFTGVYKIFFLLKTDCGYSLEPPGQGGSNEYQQSMFWAEIWKMSEFFIWKLSIFGGKISVYVNKRVFVMLRRPFSDGRKHSDKVTWL